LPFQRFLLQSRLLLPLTLVFPVSPTRHVPASPGWWFYAFHPAPVSWRLFLPSASRFCTLAIPWRSGERPDFRFVFMGGCSSGFLTHSDRHFSSAFPSFHPAWPPRFHVPPSSLGPIVRVCLCVGPRDLRFPTLLSDANFFACFLIRELGKSLRRAVSFFPFLRDTARRYYHITAHRLRFRIYV